MKNNKSKQPDHSIDDLIEITDVRDFLLHGYKSVQITFADKTKKRLRVDHWILFREGYIKMYQKGLIKIKFKTY